MREFGCVNFTFTRISPNVLNHVAASNLYFAHICWISLWAKTARETHTLAASYKQNTAKMGEIHGTVNLGFNRPVHEEYRGESYGAVAKGHRRGGKKQHIKPPPT